MDLYFLGMFALGVHQKGAEFYPVYNIPSFFNVMHNSCATSCTPLKTPLKKYHVNGKIICTFFSYYLSVSI